MPLPDKDTFFFLSLRENPQQNYTTYGVQFQGDRSQMAKPLEGGQNLQGGDGPLAAQILRAGHVPLPFGSGPARRPSAGLHRLGHLLALQAAQGIQRPPPDGLRRLRPSRRAVCDPDGAASRRHDRAEHRPLPRTAGQDRILVRLGPRGAHVRPRILQVDAVGCSPIGTTVRNSRRAPSRN